MRLVCTMCQKPVESAGGQYSTNVHAECQDKEILSDLRDATFGAKVCSKCGKTSDWLMVIINTIGLQFHCRKCAVDQVVFNSGVDSDSTS